MVTTSQAREIGLLDPSRYVTGTEIITAAPPVAGTIISDDIIPPKESYSQIVRSGQIITIVDIGANQSADCLLYNADNTEERYSVQETITAQKNVYIRTGTVLYSNLSRPMMTVIHNDVDRQDTLGGACSKESNTLRYGHHTEYQHACRENFLHEGAQWGLTTRDLVSNINWFMNVPVEADGSLGIVDGISGPGKKVALRAHMDVLVIISNCPQVNNPCNDFNLTPLQIVISNQESSDV